MCGTGERCQRVKTLCRGASRAVVRRYTAHMLDSLVQDLRHALRHLRRSPGFASAAVVTLGLGIGANSAMFSLVNVLLLRPLPIADPHGLIAISGRNQQQQLQLTPIPAIESLNQEGPFQPVCGYNAGVILSIEANGSPAQAIGGLVTGECFAAFGVAPILGRTITDEDAPLFTRGRMVTVIGHRLWTRLFNAEASVIGQSIKVEGATLEIIGVMPEGFVGLHPHSSIDFFAPFDTWSPARADRRPAASHIVGRLKPGITFAQAARQIDAQWSAVMEFAAPATMSPAERQAMLRARPRVEHFGTGFSIYRDLYSQPVVLMFGLTVVLLAMACLNLGGLLLSRAIERRPETAIRLALGGSRWRVARQWVIENLIVSLGGAVLAIPLAFSLVRIVVELMPQGVLMDTGMFTPDATVIGVTALVGAIAGLVMSVAPIQMIAPRRVFTGVGSDRTVAPATTLWARGLLVVQVALSMVMVIGAGLLGRSLYLLQQVDTGVRAENVTVARLYPLPNAYRTLNDAAYYPQLVDRIAALPGVSAVGYGRFFPRLSLAFPGDPIAFVGDPDGAARARLEAVSPGYFETLGIPLIHGRLNNWTDNAQRRHVAVVSEGLARSLQPDGQVVGRRVRYGSAPQDQDVEIIGVVRNATMGNSRRSDLPMLFRPAMQLPLFGRYPTILIRHDPQALSTVTTGLRQIVADGGAEFVLDMHPLQTRLDRAPASERMSAAIAITLGMLAIVLAFVGVFGMLACAVSRRTREIGVRAAVGADQADVMWMVIREGLVLSAIGVAIGVPAASAGGQVLGSLVFGITPRDPLTFGSAIAFFLVLGLTAGLVPARRAARVDPVIALRSE